MGKLTKGSRSLEGRIALVTGAGSGMGRATAYVLADEGVQLALFDLNEAGLGETVDAIEGAGGRVKGWTVDLAEPGAAERAVEDAVSHFGGLDILINNAGISIFTPVDADNYLEIWDKHLSVLLTAQVRMVRAALPALRRSDAARIVNIAPCTAGPFFCQGRTVIIKLQGDAHHVIAFFGQLGRHNRAIHPPRHSHNNPRLLRGFGKAKRVERRIGAVKGHVDLQMIGRNIGKSYLFTRG